LRLIDLTGQRFSRLSVVARVTNRGKDVAWLCLCDCGAETRVLGGNLRSGRQVSCGCQKAERIAAYKHRPLRDLTGATFGRWRVCGLAVAKGRGRQWNCECECGAKAVVPAGALLAGVTKSCGCLQRELVGARARTHGLSGTAQYRSLKEMVRRARKHRVAYEEVDPIKVLNDGGWTCYICGTDTPRSLRGSRATNAPEVDHIVPLAKGGPHTYSNTACACRSCNMSKGARLNFVPASLLRPIEA
jgi:hypothetical protein